MKTAVAGHVRAKQHSAWGPPSLSLVPDPTTAPAGLWPSLQGSCPLTALLQPHPCRAHLSCLSLVLTPLLEVRKPENHLSSNFLTTGSKPYQVDGSITKNGGSHYLQRGSGPQLATPTAGTQSVPFPTWCLPDAGTSCPLIAFSIMLLSSRIPITKQAPPCVP